MPSKKTTHVIIYGNGNCVNSQLQMPDAQNIENLQEEIRILEADLNWAKEQIVIRDVIIEALQKCLAKKKKIGLKKKRKMQ